MSCFDDIANVWDGRIPIPKIENLYGLSGGLQVLKIAIDDHGFAPERAHPEDAGLDLRTPIGFVLEPNTSVVIDTKVHVEIPKGWAGLLVSKSGLNTKASITSTGLIDSGYTGSIAVKLYNHGKNEYEFRPGDKISQLVFISICTPELQLVKVEDLADSERGSNGYGSSGR